MVLEVTNNNCPIRVHTGRGYTLIMLAMLCEQCNWQQLCSIFGCNICEHLCVLFEPGRFYWLLFCRRVLASSESLCVVL